MERGHPARPRQSCCADDGAVRPCSRLVRTAPRGRPPPAGSAWEARSTTIPPRRQGIGRSSSCAIPPSRRRCLRARPRKSPPTMPSTTAPRSSSIQTCCGRASGSPRSIAASAQQGRSWRSIQTSWSSTTEPSPDGASPASGISTAAPTASSELSERASPATCFCCCRVRSFRRCCSRASFARIARRPRYRAKLFTAFPWLVRFTLRLGDRRSRGYASTLFAPRTGAAPTSKRHA